MKEAVTYLLEESGINFDFKSANELKINGRIQNLNTFRHWFTIYLTRNLSSLPALFLEVEKMRKTNKLGFKTLLQEIFEQILEELWPESEAHEQISSQRVQAINPKFIRELYPVQDILDKERVSLSMYHLESHTLSDVSYQHWKMAVDKKTHDDRLSRVIPGVFVYDPYDPNQITKSQVSGYEVNKFNLYRKPQWTEIKPTRNKDGTVVLPKIAKKFFTHLFPQAEAREFVYTWMFHMLTKRARTYLYLPAPQNTGKTTFAYLCGALVGRDNFELGKSDFAETKFNAFVSRKRLIILDEYNCWSHDEKDTLKRIINDRIQVEAKGVDQKTVDNYCSFIICNNNAEGIALDPVDRRFSVPEMTTEKIFNSLTEDELAFINTELENEESQFICDIGHWVMEKFSEPKYSKDYAWQKVRFEEVVFASAREGMKYIVDQILNKKASKYQYTKLRSEYKSLVGRNAHFPPHFKVREYFENFKFKGKRIVQVHWDGVSLELIPEGEYMPEKKDEF